MGMFRNDERSMWLVGEKDEEVRVGFVVSFSKRLQLIPHLQVLIKS